jgi:hypothetical protein
MTQPPDQPEPPRAATLVPGMPVILRLPDLTTPGRPEVTQETPEAPVAAPAFADEIRGALSYEKGLAGKALVAIALVAVVLAVRFFLLG